VTIIYAVVNGYTNDVEPTKIRDFEDAFHRFVESNNPEILQSIQDNGTIDDETEEKLKKAIEGFKATGAY
jgi:F-type H+-transporting ATPase subunit alpha